VLSYSQRQFYALDLGQHEVDLTSEPTELLKLYGLEVAEADATLTLAGSVYSLDDDAIRDSFSVAGPRVVTFSNVLRWHAIPLAEALRELLSVIGKAMGAEVELEFAVDMGDWGRPARGSRRKVPRLYVLQARPMAGRDDERIDIDFDAFPDDQVLIRTERSLGNGRVSDVRDIVYVSNWALHSHEARSAAEDVRAIDAALRAVKRRYLLIGPGRWGSSDASLGIPTEWLQISGAAVIVELPLRGEVLESSQGTHFFHNVTAARVGYLSASPEANASVDRAWLDAAPAIHEGPLVRHIELAEPLRIYLDGRRGRAIILLPG
jgi:hypothetical protein